MWDYACSTRAFTDQHVKGCTNNDRRIGLTLWHTNTTRKNCSEWLTSDSRHGLTQSCNKDTDLSKRLHMHDMLQLISRCLQQVQDSVPGHIEQCDASVKISKEVYHWYWTAIMRHWIFSTCALCLALRLPTLHALLGWDLSGNSIPGIPVCWSNNSEGTM